LAPVKGVRLGLYIGGIRETAARRPFPALSSGID